MNFVKAAGLSPSLDQVNESRRGYQPHHLDQVHWSDMSDSNTGHCSTPTDTGTPFHYGDEGSQSLSLSLSPPLANETFIIRHPQTKLVITLKGDKLYLHPLETTNKECQWKILQVPSGWFRFRNIPSETYIRHNNDSSDWRFIADAKSHRYSEYFMTRPSLNGRYELLVKHWDTVRSMRAGGEEQRELVVAESGEKGVAWEFIKVG